MSRALHNLNMPRMPVPPYGVWLKTWTTMSAYEDRYSVYRLNSTCPLASQVEAEVLTGPDCCSHRALPEPRSMHCSDHDGTGLHIVLWRDLSRPGFELTPRSWTVMNSPIRRCFSIGIPPG